MVLLLSFIAGAPLTLTVEEVSQGVATGIQGHIVMLHVPKEGIFAMGIQSRLFPIGLLQPFTLGINTFKDPGAAPIVQLKFAPSTRNLGIIPPYVTILN